jgi:hypothetical protein
MTFTSKTPKLFVQPPPPVRKNAYAVANLGGATIGGLQAMRTIMRTPAGSCSSCGH